MHALDFAVVGGNCIWRELPDLLLLQKVLQNKFFAEAF